MVQLIEEKLFLDFLENSKTKEYRSLKQFALDEVVLPKGVYKGLGFDLEFQPFVELYFDLFDSDEYRELPAMGPVQSGKTTNLLNIPAMYVLFELGEDIIYGIPNETMGKNKWNKELKPLIESSSYYDQLPDTGKGSKGGYVDEITFKNGATLKFMIGSGGDENRSGYTCRYIFITEVDKFIKEHRSSKEADPISQIVARAESYDKRARIFLECTVTDKSGRIYQYWKRGDSGNIVNPCPSCKKYHLYSRDDLKGWDGQESRYDAEQNAHWECPHCNHHFTEEERSESNKKGVFLLKGQTITKSGKVKGDKPKNNVCGFRYTAFHNMFVSAGTLGSREWENLHSHEEEDTNSMQNKEKALQQFVYVVPYQDPHKKEAKLKSIDIRTRQSGWGRGVLPPGTFLLVSGMDIGKWRCHWVDLAVYKTMDTVRFHVPNYGVIRPQSDEGTVNEAILSALYEHADEHWSNKYPIVNSSDPLGFYCVGIDARYETDAIVEFCRAQQGFYPTFGFGTTSFKPYTREYRPPPKEGKDVDYIGNGYDLKYVEKYDLEVINLNADYWKKHIHQEYLVATENDEERRITLFKAPQQEHIDFSRQMVSEQPVTIYDANTGEIDAFERVKDNNHYFDGFAIARAMADLCIDHLIQEGVEVKGGFLDAYK